jgi:5'-nucleotidase
MTIDRKAKKTTVDVRPLITICNKVFEGTETCLASTSKPDYKLADRTFEGSIVEPDSRMQPLLAPFFAGVASKKKEPLHVTLAAPFVREYNRESALGNLITDTMRHSIPGADFAVINSGGLRSDFESGDLTYGDLFEVLPFDNFFAVIRLTGAEIEEMFRLSSMGRQGLLQVSGLRVVIDPHRDAALPQERRNNVVRIVDENGQPLDRDHMYTIATTDFVASGGDGVMPLIKSLPEGRITILGNLKLRDTLAAEWKKTAGPAPLKPHIDGRIEIMDGGSASIYPTGSGK